MRQFLDAAALFLALTLLFRPPVAIAQQRPDPETATRLRAEFRNGQTFLTWTEADTLNVTAYRVFRHDRPITEENLTAATVIRDSVHHGSGMDYLLAAGHRRIAGFVVDDLAEPLAAGSGLYVHTARVRGEFYYAVSSLDRAGNLRGGIVPGSNSLDRPIREEPDLLRPVLAEQRRTSAGRADIYTHWADRSMHPREGMAWRFGVALHAEYVPEARHPLLVVLHGAGGRHGTLHQGGADWVVLYPEMRNVNYHRTPDMEFGGNGSNFWFGLNENFYDPEHWHGGLNVNYDERRVLWTIDWVMRRYNVDPERVHIQGSSMGGYATLSLSFRHPELFASAFAMVPPTDLHRMSAYGDSIAVSHYGPLERNIMTNEGSGFFDRADLVKFARERPEVDFPVTMTVHGKNDNVISWEGPPLFFRAMQESMHGLIAFWTRGGHNATAPGSDTPPEYHEIDLRRLRRNESYPAIVSASTNDDPGDLPEQGDPAGQLNARFEWRDIVDRPGEYGVTIAPLNGRELSAAADIVPRRLQRFRVEPGGSFAWENIDMGSRRAVQSGSLRPDSNGLLVVKGFRINPAGNRLIILRK